MYVRTGGKHKSAESTIPLLVITKAEANNPINLKDNESNYI